MSAEELKIIEKEYIKACRRAQRSKRLNPSGKNFDCEAISYDFHKGELPASELKWYTEWSKWWQKPPKIIILALPLSVLSTKLLPRFIPKRPLAPFVPFRSGTSFQGWA